MDRRRSGRERPWASVPSPSPGGFGAAAARGGERRSTSTDNGNSAGAAASSFSPSGFSAFKNIPQAAILPNPRRSMPSSFSMENRRPVTSLPRTPRFGSASFPPPPPPPPPPLPPRPNGNVTGRGASVPTAILRRPTTLASMNGNPNLPTTCSSNSSAIVCPPSTPNTTAIDADAKLKQSSINPESPCFKTSANQPSTTTAAATPTEAPSTVDSGKSLLTISTTTTASSTFTPFTSPLDYSMANLKLDLTIATTPSRHDDLNGEPETPTELATPETSFAESSLLPGIESETRKVYVYSVIGDVAGSKGRTEAKVFDSECYASICGDHPAAVEESELWNYLSTIMHDEDKWGRRAWPCNMCSKKAVRCSAHAVPYLELEEPIVIVYQLPACGSALCAKSGEDLVMHLLELMKGQPPYLIDYRCIACGKDTGQRDSKYKLCIKCCRYCHSFVWPEYNNARVEERRRTLTVGLGVELTAGPRASGTTTGSGGAVRSERTTAQASGRMGMMAGGGRTGLVADGHREHRRRGGRNRHRRR